MSPASTGRSVTTPSNGASDDGEIERGLGLRQRGFGALHSRGCDRHRFSARARLRQIELRLHGIPLRQRRLYCRLRGVALWGDHPLHRAILRLRREQCRVGSFHLEAGQLLVHAQGGADVFFAAIGEGVGVALHHIVVGVFGLRLGQLDFHHAGLRVEHVRCGRMGVLFVALCDGLGQHCAGGGQLGFDDGDLFGARPGFRQIELRPRQSQPGLGLLDAEFGVGGVEAYEHIACRHLRALGDRRGDNRAARTGAERDRARRLDDALGVYLALFILHHDRNCRVICRLGRGR